MSKDLIFEPAVKKSIRTQQEFKEVNTLYCLWTKECFLCRNSLLNSFLKYYK